MAAQGQQHPIAIYLWIWFLLFVFSAFSYGVDYLGFAGMARWSLIVLFMLLKAGFIVAIFMHMKWERFAMIYALLLPPQVLLLFMFLMATESSYTWTTRVEYMASEPYPEPNPPPGIVSHAKP